LTSFFKIGDGFFRGDFSPCTKPAFETPLRVNDMSWTDDRVARLSKLWADGLSASQIAADLGGVTRNAVIGKVHRLGLSGRVKPAGKSGASARRKAPGGRKPNGTTRTPPRQTPRGTGAAGSKPQPHEDVLLKEPVSLEAPDSRKITLMQLTETTCKWPTGDPTMPGFSFCGHTSQEDKPYCEFHSKLAFQPASERRRRR
jgi:GcrA cell cycle regulator